jgi:hypothetical protein
MRPLKIEVDIGRILEEEVASVSFQDACRMTPCGPTKGHQHIENGEWETFLDGSSRRVTVRSLAKRRERLLAEAAQARGRHGRPVPPSPKAKKSRAIDNSPFPVSGPPSKTGSAP